MKVSVIVPVYNTSKYLEKCLNSLIKQTLEEIEIIVVNDGSTDDSLEIIDTFHHHYPDKVKFISKENGGLSSARNAGLERAHGEYIGFVDSDDYVAPTMFEEMYAKAKEKDFDVVVCDVIYIYPNKTQIVSSNITHDLGTDKEIKESMLHVYPAVWNKIYKKELFSHGVLFKEKVWFEDVEFLYRLYPYIKTIGVTSKALIYYVQHIGAITSTFDERLYHYVDNWNGILDFYRERGICEEYRNVLEYCYVRYLYATFMKRATNYSDKKKFDEALEVAIYNVKTHFPNYRKNKYFYQNGLKGYYLLLFNKQIAHALFKKEKRRKK